MLHREQMLGFTTELDWPAGEASSAAMQAQGQAPSVWRQAARIAGNTVVGSAFLGALLAAPWLLQRILSLL